MLLIANYSFAEDASTPQPASSFEYGIGPTFSRWQSFIKSDNDSLKNITGDYNLAGLSFIGQTKSASPHIFSFSLSARYSYSGTTENSDNLNTLHFLRSDHFVLFDISGSYRYKIFEQFSLGVGLSASLFPADLGYTFRQAVLGSVLFDGQLEAEVRLVKEFSLLFAVGSGGQGLSTDDAFVGNSYQTVTAIYWF